MASTVSLMPHTVYGINGEVREAAESTLREIYFLSGDSLPYEKVQGVWLDEYLDGIPYVLSRFGFPKAAMIGGVARVEKLNMLENLVTQVDELVICGAFADVFLKKGLETSFEKGIAGRVQDILDKAEANNCRVTLPVDCICHHQITDGAMSTFSVQDAGIPKGWRATDCGPRSTEIFADVFRRSKTIVWYGPAGVSEGGTQPSCTEVLLSEAAAVCASGGKVMVGGHSLVEMARQWGQRLRTNLRRLDRQDQAVEQTVQTACTVVHSQGGARVSDQDCRKRACGERSEAPPEVEYLPHSEWDPSSPRNPKASYASLNVDPRTPTPCNPITLGNSVSRSSPPERQQRLEDPATVSPLEFRPSSQLSYTRDGLDEQGYDPSGGQEVVSKLAELSSFRGGLISHPVDLASTRQDASPQASREGMSDAETYDVIVGCDRKRSDNPGRAEGSKAGGWVDGIEIRSHVLPISSPQQASPPTSSEAMPVGLGEDRVNARHSSYDGRVDLGTAIPVSPRQGIVPKALANPVVGSVFTNQGMEKKWNGWPPIHVEPSESTSGEAVSYNEKGNGWPPIRVEPSESTSGEAVSYNSVLSCAVGHSEGNGPSEPVLNGDGDTIGTVEPSCALEGSDGLAFLAGSSISEGCTLTDTSFELPGLSTLDGFRSHQVATCLPEKREEFDSSSSRSRGWLYEASAGPPLSEDGGGKQPNSIKGVRDDKHQAAYNVRLCQEGNSSGCTPKASAHVCGLSCFPAILGGGFLRTYESSSPFASRVVGSPGPSSTLLRQSVSLPSWVQRQLQDEKGAHRTSADEIPKASEMLTPSCHDVDAGVSPGTLTHKRGATSSSRFNEPRGVPTGKVSTDPNHKPLGFSPDSPRVQGFSCGIDNADPNHKPLGFSPDSPRVQGFSCGIDNADPNHKPLGFSPVSPQVQGFSCGIDNADPNRESLGFSPNSPQVQGFPCGVANPDISHNPFGFIPVLLQECGSLRSPAQQPRYESLGFSSFSSCEGCNRQVPGAAGTQVAAQAVTESQVPRSLCAQTTIEDLSKPFTPATGPAFYQIFTEEELCDVESETGVDLCWDQPWDVLTSLCPALRPECQQPHRPSPEHQFVPSGPTPSAVGILKRPTKQTTVDDRVHHGERVTWQVPLVGLSNSSCKLARAQEPILPWRLFVEWLGMASLPWPFSQLVSCRSFQMSMLECSCMWKCLPIQTVSAASCNVSAPPRSGFCVFLDLRMPSVTSITFSGCRAGNVSEYLQLPWGESLHPDKKCQKWTLTYSEVAGLARCIGVDKNDLEWDSGKGWDDSPQVNGAQPGNVHSPQVNGAQPGNVHSPQVDGAQLGNVHSPQVNYAQPGCQARNEHSPCVGCTHVQASDAILGHCIQASEVQVGEVQLSQQACSQPQVPKVQVGEVQLSQQACSQPQVPKVQVGEVQLSQQACSQPQVPKVQAGKVQLSQQACSQPQVPKVQAGKVHLSQQACSQSQVPEVKARRIARASRCASARSIHRSRHPSAKSMCPRSRCLRRSACDNAAGAMCCVKCNAEGTGRQVRCNAL